MRERGLLLDQALADLDNILGGAPKAGLDIGRDLLVAGQACVGQQDFTRHCALSRRSESRYPADG